MTLAPLWGSSASATTDPAPVRPNIIWIMAEDIGTDLACYGTAGVRTPNLDRMAAEGALFTKAYCSNPICSPNRSAMMVGAHQNEFDAQHHRSNRNKPLLGPYKPITYWLRESGYTCILGSSDVRGRGQKIDCNFKCTATGPYDGETQFGLFDKVGDFEANDRPFFNQIQLNVTHRGDWWNQIRRDSENPVSMDAIQLPLYLADTPQIRYDWAAYLDTIEYMDNEVGRLFERLEREGLVDNTIVIFVGDNGRCNLRGKGYLHEPGIHVPLIIWAPDIYQPGTVIEGLVCTTDIAASVLNLAGIELPDYVTGRPFIGVIDPQYRDYVYSARDIWDEIDEACRSITTKRWKYIRNYMPEVPWEADQAYLDLNRPALHVMRQLNEEGRLDANQQIFFADQKPAEELYDLEGDPQELYNLAPLPAYQGTLEDMRGHMAEWQANHRDYGLEDLGQRTPDPNMRSVLVREAAQSQAPELWQRLESGELMETQSWKRFIEP